jgi:hypothetical protein
MRMTNWLAQHTCKFRKDFTSTIGVWRRLLSRLVPTRQEGRQRRGIMSAASFATCLLMCAGIPSASDVRAQTRNNVEFASLNCVSKQKTNDTCAPLQVKGQLYLPARSIGALIGRLLAEGHA